MKALRDKLRRYRTYLRLRPFDTTTEEGRASERYRRAALASVTSLMARGTRIATALATVPLVLHFVGNERYGMWLTMSSIIAFFSLANLGLSDGLVNPLTEAVGRGEEKRARRIVSSTFFLLVMIAGGLTLVFLCAWIFIPWDRVFNVSSTTAVAEAGPAVLVLFFCWAASFVLGFISRVHQSHQDIHVNNIWEMLGTIMGLAGVLVCVFVVGAGLPWLVLVLAGSLPLAYVFNGLHLFRRRPGMRPSIADFHRPTATGLVRHGSWFLLMELARLLIFNAGNIIIAHALGPDEVPEYAVPFRLFLMINMLLSLVVHPLWAAYVDAIARGDADWVVRTLVRSTLLVIAVGLVPAGFMVLFGDVVVHLWVGDSVSPTIALLLPLGIWQLGFGVSQALGFFLNGVGMVRVHASIRAFQAVVGVGLQVWLISVMGLVGIAWALAISEIGFRLLPSLWATARGVKRLRAGRVNPAAGA